MTWPVLRRIRVAAALVVAVGSVAACASPDEGDLAFAVGALSQCSQSAPLAAPDKVEVYVRGPVCDDAGCVVEELAHKSAKWGESVSIGGIPEGEGREVTILGRSGDQTVAFARATDVTVRKDKTTDVQAILSRFGDASCPKLEAPEFAHRLFATATSTANGKVIVIGGFTGVTGEGDAMKIAAPDAGVYEYDPLTGGLTKKTDMRRARGGHAAVFVEPRHAGDNCSTEAAPSCAAAGCCWVVVFGGIDALSYHPDGDAFPFSFTKDDVAGAFSDYEIYDVATGLMVDSSQDSVECLGCCEEDGDPLPSAPAQCVQANVECGSCFLRRPMAAGRVFAQAQAMSDGFVIITGGGDWPAAERSEHRLADIFDPKGNYRTGGFQGEMVLPRTEAIRAGHSMTFVEANEAGRYRFLLWGGTSDVEDADAGPNPIGETYLESSQQFKELPGVFQQVDVRNPELVKPLFFHSMTPLSGRRFLLAGGVRASGDGFEAPNAEDAYVLTLSGEDVISVSIERVAGLDSGRFLHTATSHDGHRAVLFGGYTGFGGAPVGDLRLFVGAEPEAGRPNRFEPIQDAALLPRAGHRAVVLQDDTVLLVGGAGAPTDLGSGPALFEVYTPSVLGSWY